MIGKREYLLKLENNLMLGGGRWIADFKESFWKFSFNEVTFDMMLYGGMRPKGFALSRLASTLLMPNYSAACFVFPGDPALKRLAVVLKAVHLYMQENEIKWSWVVIPCESAFSPQARASIERNEVRELGIALVDLQSQDVVTSRSYIGRRMAHLVNTFQ